MARILTLDTDPRELSGFLRHSLYNGVDCCSTKELADLLRKRMSPMTRRLYKFEMGCQAPAFQMMLRGVRVDLAAIQEALTSLEADYATEARAGDTLLHGVWDGVALETGRCSGSDKRHKWPRGVPDTDRVCERCGSPRVVREPFNPNSSDQAWHLFYEVFKLPPMQNKKGEVSTDEEVLQRIERKWAGKLPAFCATRILAARAIRKQIGVLKSGVSANGRIHSTFVVGGAWTGRWSSTASPFDEGTNLQNIAEKLRYIFIADPGMELFYADLEQAESCCVAHLAGDESYIAAHASGDVHTYVSRLLWPELPWTGDLARDKAIAGNTHPEWDRDHDYRYNAKRIQHGSNYLLSPTGVARIAHIPKAAADEAQQRYFDAFPGIRRWHHATIAAQKVAMVLTSPSGRICQFFGRPWDEHTQKQGVAFVPQSMVGDILNVALWRVWNEMDPGALEILAQVHDAILGQFRAKATVTVHGQRYTAAERLLELMRVRVPIVGVDGKERVMVIGTEMKCGQNWSKFNDDPKKGRINLGGLR
jgi:hypothetical protein